MKVLDIYAAFRSDVDDLGGDTGTVPAGFTYYWESSDAGCLWKNTDLVRYLNQTLREMAVRRPIMDESETTICQPTVRANTAKVELDPRILFIERVTHGDRLLTKASVDWLDHHITGWETQVGDPLYYAERYHEHALMVTPVPEAQTTLQLRVGRLPLDDMTWASRTAEFEEFPDHALPAILAGMKMYAYLKRDADTGNTDLAKMARGEFDQYVGPPRSLENIWARRMNANRGCHATALAY